MAERYVASLVLDGSRVLVVGGGAQAMRLALEMAGAGADVVVVDQEPIPELRELGRAGIVRLLEREWRYYDGDGAVIVVAATGDFTLDHAVVQQARKERSWIYVPSDETASNFFPAGPGSAGASEDEHQPRS
jgi:uroporphyrin-III C-methyltransferase/precorrin-2 dehydrogenase/sirohydrochlorin ferrochelatase